MSRRTRFRREGDDISRAAGQRRRGSARRRGLGADRHRAGDDDDSEGLRCGTRLRLRGRASSASGGKRATGDQYVTLKMVIGAAGDPNWRTSSKAGPAAPNRSAPPHGAAPPGRASAGERAMISLDELVRRFAELERIELTRWIENRWVCRSSRTKSGRWEFHEVDVARVELILHVRREFAVDDEAMPLVLGLLDQVYSLRRQMRRLCDAIECSRPTSATRSARPAAGRTGAKR